MKNLKSFALAAISLLGFAACQQVEIAPDVKPEASHTVTFVAGAPETKTTVDISDDVNAKFAWTADDKNRISIYENKVAANTIVCGLDAGKMTIMASFDDPTPEAPSYLAVVNKSNITQMMSSEAYDEEADILVSKEVSEFDGENGVQLQFKREVAIAKMTLKGLDAGEVVNMVTVSSTADIAGGYGIEGWTDPKTSLDIASALYLEGEGYSIVANASGEAVVWFTCIPQDNATLTVKIEAADGDSYTKAFSRAISLSQGDVNAFGVVMTKDAKSAYILYEGETLIEGDYIIVSSTTTTAMVASDTDEDDRLDYKTVEITNGTISSSLQQQEWHIAPSATEGYWTIFNNKANAYASSTGAKNKAQLLSTGTDDKALWSCAKTSGETTYDFTNKQNTTNNVNSTLRYNLGFGFACYSTSTGKPLQLYRKDARTPLEAPKSLSVSDMTISWSPVEGAIGYRVVIGTVTNDVTVASYTFTGEADYYDVSVIALADENSETNRDSNAATLTDAKFGTPTLATPVLSEGVIDETSVAFSWTKDTRATNGYHWALYNGETLVKEATETSATKVTVTDLAFGTTYTAKVFAIAVEGEKPYVQSATATLDLATKAKTTISTIVEAGTGTTEYAIADLTVMAVSGSHFVVKDETGLMYCFKSGAVAGDVVTLEGTYEAYQGLEEFKPTSYTKTSTATVEHGTASDLNASNVAAYVENPGIQYVKANATVASDGSLKIGDVAVYQYGNSLTSYAGRTINLYGYTLGYNTSKTNIVFLQTSVEIDQTVPYLAVSPTSKTWASDETNAEVFTVTTNTEGEKDWTVSSKTLDWASIAVDKTEGTITVTPNGANTTDTAREATLTVSHAAGTLAETITLTQKAASSGGETKAWKLVTDASTLAVGDQLIIVSTSKGFAAGAIASSVMGSVAVTITDNVISSLPSEVVVLTLGGSTGAWTLSNSDGQLLGATAAKKVAWGSGTTTWSISISDNSATIQNGTSTYGRFLYNVNDPRFTTYTSATSSSMLLPEIYRYE